MTSLANRLLFLLLLVSIGFLSISIVPLHLMDWHNGGDFAHYYTSALLLRSGENPYHGTLEALLLKNNFPPCNIVCRATNPPALIVLSIPFTFFAPQTAFWLWNILQVAVFLLGAWLFYRSQAEGNSLQTFIFSLISLFVSLPFVMHLRWGQTQLLVCGLIMTALAFQSKRPKFSAFVFGVSASLKLFTLPLVLIAVREDIRAHRSAVGGLSFFVLGFLTLPIIGELMAEPGLNVYYVQQVIPYVKQLQFQIAEGTTLTFLLFFLVWWLRYGFDAPSTLASQIGTSINILVSAVLIALIAVAFWRFRKSKRTTALALPTLVACLLCSPVAWPHYFVLLYPVFLCLWTEMSSGHKIRSGLVIALYGMAAVTTGFSHAAPVVTAFWGPTTLIGLLGLLLLEEKQQDPAR